MLLHLIKNDIEAVIFCKDSIQPQSILTPEEERFLTEWTGGIIAIVTSVEDALAVIE